MLTEAVPARTGHTEVCTGPLHMYCRFQHAQGTQRSAQVLCVCIVDFS
ncbi:hypothetical protein LEMLEM_LOCUS11254 [Lemmus lemmus]